jgi:hypothetical protein
MKRSRLKSIEGFFLAALLVSPVWGSAPPQPGTINYIEGKALIDGHALSQNSAGSTQLAVGQSISTQNGKVEMLLTPGIFLRVGDNSTVRMISPGLANTTLALEKGRAMVEVAEIRPENNVRIIEGSESTQLLKPGLYDFDGDQGQIRVFDGEAQVQTAGQQIDVKRGHNLNLHATGRLKARKFDRKAYEDDFYRWASLRAYYVAEANVDAARTYGGGAASWYGGGWYGDGWYWDPWFEAYTFIPGDGIFFSPFGCGFYSPWFAFRAPYYGYGYGYGSGYHHRFGPGYRPHGNAVSAFNGRAFSVRGGSFGRGGGFRSGVGFGSGGFRGVGGGFRGGGGGFHGGGGGGHR